MPTEPSGSTTKCPNCGRDVEAGFRFCDSCGTKLEAGPTTSVAAETKPDDAGWKPLIERWRDRRRTRAESSEAVSAESTEAAASTVEAPKPAPPPDPPKADPSPSPATKDDAPALPLERAPIQPLPARSETKAEPTQPVATAAPQTPPVASTPTPPVAPPTQPAPRITSRPMKAEDLRGGTAGIAGRLRWQDKEEPTAEADKTEEHKVVEREAPSWRPAPARGTIPARSAAATIGVFLLHVLLAFVAGAVLLGIAAAVASITSDGAVALLEVRALPILIAGSTAIIVFSLFRTGPRARGSRRAIGLSVLIGFVILVAAVALAYHPSRMTDAQRELDRTLGIFGAEAATSVQRFEADVDQWNTEVNNYREHLRDIDKARDEETEAERLAGAEEAFRVRASGSEEALDGIFERMRSHADAVEHAPLREALQDLAAIFSDELSGIKLITRGFVEDDQALIQSGNTRFTTATGRAADFFAERVRPLLERGDIEPGPLEAAVTELRG